MKRKLFSVLLALVLACSLCLVTAVPVAAQQPVTLETVGPGALAEWTTAQANTGSHSVYLDTGDTGGGIAAISIMVDPIAIAEFTGVSYFVWEPTGTEHGGQFPGDWNIPYPYGDPYIAILLDTDGDGASDDSLWGTGSTAGGTPPEPVYDSETNPLGPFHPTPTPETWVEMAEGYGFRDSNYSLNDGILEDNWHEWGAGMVRFEEREPEAGDVWRIDYPPGSIEEWKTWLATNIPTTTVVGVQIVFGEWLNDPIEGVYVDDVTISGITYDLEPPTGDTDVGGDVPGVTGISPAVGDIDTTVPVTITGFGLTGASAVTFTGGGITVDPSTIVVVSDTEITADLAIAPDAPSGARDVVVTIPTGTITGSGLFTVLESFTLTAPSGIDLGFMMPSVTTLGQSITDGIVVTNVPTWSVEAIDVKVTDCGKMVNVGMNPLAAKFQISDDGVIYADADIGITYTDANALLFYVSQAVATDDPVGSYAITITFTGWY